MEVINPFIQENKLRIINFLDEISVSVLEVIASDYCVQHKCICDIIKCRGMFVCLATQNLATCIFLTVLHQNL